MRINETTVIENRRSLMFTSLSAFNARLRGESGGTDDNPLPQFRCDKNQPMLKIRNSGVILDDLTLGGCSLKKGSVVVVSENGTLTVQNSVIEEISSATGDPVFKGVTGSVIRIRALLFRRNKGPIAVQAFNPNSLYIHQSHFERNKAKGKALIVVDNGFRIDIADSRFVRNNGRCVAITDTDGIVKNTTFRQNRATQGTALLLKGASKGIRVAVVESQFVRNRATRVAGCLFAKGPLLNVTIRESTATRNSAKEAAVIMASDVLHFAIIKSRFVRNKAKFHGGVLYSETTNEETEGELEIKESKFKRNSARDGGGVSVKGPLRAMISSGTFFLNNTASNHGGAIRISRRAVVSILDANIQLNQANSGGGIHCQGSSDQLNRTSLLLIDTTLNDNQATENGGGISVRAASVQIRTNTVLEGNRARRGGAICAQSTGHVSFTSCRLFANEAENGGAVYVGANNQGQDTLRIQMGINVFLENNTASVHGGALYLLGNGSRFSAEQNVHFQGNEAQQRGGAIHAVNCTLSMSNSVIFISNRAISGGAVYALADRASMIMLISSTWFQANLARSGGALYFSSSPAANQSLLQVGLNGDTRFIENLASQDGGAVYVSGHGILDIADSGFRSNVAKRNGGSIHAQQGGMIAMHRIEFSTNEARNGGSISAYNTTEIVLDNVTFTTNTGFVGGALYLSDSKSLQARSVIFTRNVAANATGGGAIYSKGNGDRCEVNLKRCIFSENDAGRFSFRTDRAQSTKGGAIHATGTVDVLLAMVEFRRNQATESGGAVWLDAGSRIRALNSTWIGNDAQLYGGAMAIVSISLRSVIRGCRFLANSAQRGGALHLTNVISAIELRHLTFENNTAEEFGGAIFARGTSLDVSASMFQRNGAGDTVVINNQCPSRSIPYNGNLPAGGAVYLDSAIQSQSIEARFTNVRFVANVARTGGALSLQFLTTVQIVGCKFRKNEALLGGGLLLNTSLIRPPNPSFTMDTRFDSNRACEGGAVYRAGSNQDDRVQNGRVALINVKMKRNYAQMAGAAMHGPTGLDTFTLCCDCEAEPPSQLLNASFLQSFPETCRHQIQKNRHGPQGYGSRFSTDRIDLEVDPEVIVNHRSGEQLETIRIRNVDAFGQSVPNPLLEIAFVAEDNVELRGQNRTNLKRGVAVFDGVFFSALPGNHTIRVLEGSIPVKEILIIVANCSVDERIENMLCVKCEEGRFTQDPNGGCQPCPEHSHCENGRIQPKRGYWNSNPTSAKIIKCVRPSSCRQLDVQTQSLAVRMDDVLDPCSQGYRGTICGACEDGYGHVEAQKCRKCNRGGSIVAGVFVIVCLIVMTELLIKTSWSWSLDLVTTSSHRQEIRNQQQMAESSETAPNLSASGEFEVEDAPIPEHVEPTASFGIRSSSGVKDGRTLILNRAGTSGKQPVQRPHSAPSSPRRVTTRLSPVADDALHSSNPRRESDHEIQIRKPAIQTALAFDLEPAISDNYVLTKPLLAEAFKILITFFQTVSLAMFVQVDWPSPALSALKLFSFLGTGSSPYASLACMYSDDGEIPRSIQAFAFLLLTPLGVSLFLILFWLICALIDRSTSVLWQRIKNALVAVFYVSFQPICHTAFRVMNCRAIDLDGEEYVWLEDTDIICFEGSHRKLLYYLCFPLLALTVVVFPLCFIVFLLVHKNLGKTERLRSWGLLFEAYKYKRRAWELVIFVRKLLLAAVFAYGYHYSILVQTLMAIGITVFCLLAHSITSPYEKSERMLSHMETISLFGAFIVYFGAGLIHAWNSGRNVVSIVLCVVLILVVLRLLRGIMQHVMRTIDWTLGEFGKESYYSKPWLAKIFMFCRLKCSFMTARMSRVVKRYVPGRS